MTDFDFIIISHNNKDLTKQAIESVYESTILPKKIILVDNFSTDGTIEYVKEKFPKVYIIQNKNNLGYAYAVNRGFEVSQSSVVIISNNDVIISKDVFELLINDLVTNPKIGVIGVLQKYPNGKRQHSYGVIPGVCSAIGELLFVESIKSRVINNFYLKISGNYILKVGYVDGAFMAIRREAFNEVNGFDENFFFYFEESDFCKRVQDKGWLVCIDLRGEIIHYRGQYSSNKTGLEYHRIKLFVESLNKYSTKHFTPFSRKIYLFIKFLEYLFASILKKVHFLFSGIEDSNIISGIKFRLAKDVLNILKT
ncbi:MAG: glycosyltransferase family 2 protein [Candidatus Kapaibacteriales bacterium]